MQKIFAVLVAFCLLFVTVAPIADASVRIRRTIRNTQTTPYAPYYQAPTYQSPYYQTPTQVYPTSAGSTYYYSPNYVQGYTYYSTPTPGYYYYNGIPSLPAAQPSVAQGQYYFSQNYISGYTYYSTPNPGYYYYLATTATNNNSYNYSYNNNTYNTPPYNNGNMICTIINNVYQCTNNSYGPTYGTYPGCSVPDIVIGGQIWASCNALDRNVGSTAKSGWFFAGDRESSFTSYNGSNTALEWMGKQTRESSWNIGPCATGYRLPNRGEWETLQTYARANGTTVSSMVSLGLNGAYQGSRNTGGDIILASRLSVAGAYWTSSVDSGTPIVMHIGSTYAGYNTNGTDYGYVNSGYQWTYTDTGLQLLRSNTGELANVRCIR